MASACTDVGFGVASGGECAIEGLVQAQGCIKAHVQFFSWLMARECLLRKHAPVRPGGATLGEVAEVSGSGRSDGIAADPSNDAHFHAKPEVAEAEGDERSKHIAEVSQQELSQICLP